MEFVAGIIFTLLIGFIAYKIDQSVKKRKARDAYIPPSGPRPNLPIDSKQATRREP